MIQWGYFTWFPENGGDLVHPDDIHCFAGGGSHGVVGTFASALEGWVAFSFGENTIRLAPKLIHACDAPAFSYGQRVESLPPRTPVVGPISSIVWHFKRQEPFYFVGLKKSRYLTHEFRAT
jgi:hypothetical protein